jgi:hypothetical protein
MKKIFVMLLIACCSAGMANAQFSKLKGLAKKAKQAVEQVDNTKAKVEKAQQSSTVVQEVKETKETQTEVAAPVETQVKKNSLESYEKKTDNGTIVFVGDDLGMYAKAEKTDWEDVQKIVYDPKEWVANTTVVEKNALYYLYRWKKACDEGDTEKMTGEIYPRVNWCVNQIANYKKKLHNNVHWLLIYKEENYEFLDEYFNSLMLRINGLNRILFYPIHIIELYNVLESAREILNSENFNFKTYRKLILDAHTFIDKLPEVNE